MWKDPLILFILGVFVVSSSIANFMPVSFPVFRRVFGADLEQLGRIQLCYYGSAVIFTFGGGWFVGRFGYKRSIAIALMVIVSALVIIGTAQSYSMVLVGSLHLRPWCPATGRHYRVHNRGALWSNSPAALFCPRNGWIRGERRGPATLGWSLANAERFGMSWRTHTSPRQP